MATRFMATRIVEKSAGLALTWGMEHRTGYCSECATLLEFDPAVSYDPDDIDSPLPDKNYCPKCLDYRLGRLVVRQATTQPPVLTCITPKCLLRFLLQSLAYTIIMLYHRRRIAYAEDNRNKDILERYRTGDPSPKTLWGAIFANIKLTCPLCRRVEWTI